MRKTDIKQKSTHYSTNTYCSPGTVADVGNRVVNTKIKAPPCCYESGILVGRGSGNALYWVDVDVEGGGDGAGSVKTQDYALGVCF